MIDTILDAFAPKSKAATVQTLGHPRAGLIDWFGSAQENTSGVDVTPDVALTYAAVWCATRVISETLATLPCVLYRRNQDDSRERAVDDDRYTLMHDEPHPELDPVTFFEVLTAHAVLQGNGYAKIVRSRGGNIVLEPRLPDTVKPKAEGDRILYEVTQPKEELRSTEMLHVKGLGSDGLKGYSVVQYAAQTIGGGIAGDRRTGSQHGNGATPGGLLKIPTRLNKDAREALRRDWDEMHRGSENAGKIGILHGGMEFEPLSMSNTDAQFLESRQFSVREIARWFRLPPHMLADISDSSVRANIEMQAIEFVVYSMAPWITRWQQALNRKLLSREERKTLYFEFLLESLLRGDIKSRYEAYAVARQWGYMSVNEIRRAENMNAIPDGDIYLQPGNMVPAGYVPQAQPQAELQANWIASLKSIMQHGRQLRKQIEAGHQSIQHTMEAVHEQASEALRTLREDRDEIKRDIATLGTKTQVQGVDLSGQRDKLAQGWLTLYRTQLLACVRIEKAEVIKAARRQVSRGESFLSWCDVFYETHREEIAARVADCVEGWSDATGSKPDNPEAAWCGASKDMLLQACDGDPDKFCERIQATLDTFDDRARSFEL